MAARPTGLTGRVAQLVRAGRAGALDEPATDSPGRDLATRVQRLEEMVEALQDQLYRQARHDDERFTELQQRLQPEELARTLSADARRRGL
jgi:exonuclease VII large subunit